MGTLNWIGAHWFDGIQTVGIIGSLLLAVYTFRKGDRALRNSNFTTAVQNHRDIWKELYSRPDLARILKPTANLAENPVSDEEQLFVRLLVLHLDNIRRTMADSDFVTVEGLRKDIAFFFALPIPKAVWGRIKEFHDEEFIRFLEINDLGGPSSRR